MEVSGLACSVNEGDDHNIATICLPQACTSSLTELPNNNTQAELEDRLGGLNVLCFDDRLTVT